MLFEDKFPNAAHEEKHCFNETFVQRGAEQKICANCQQVLTRWVDTSFGLPICGEDCDNAIWTAYKGESEGMIMNHMMHYASEIKQELSMIQVCENKSKDIIIVVHDQIDYLRITIESIVAHTENYHIYVWDNYSGAETQAYLKDLMFKMEDKLTVMRSDANIGFIEPNNQLATWGSGEYIILLNSDVKVFGGWDTSMLGFLQQHTDVGMVGQCGGLLDETGVGGRMAFGYEIDYIPGWCLCLSRETYNKFGLFNPRLKFAYAEDSELGIRLQTAGLKIYALHLMLVHHYENKTINCVRKQGGIDVAATFGHNHDVLRELHFDYLKRRRIDVRQKTESQEAFDELIRNLE